MDSYICLIFPFAGNYAPQGFNLALGQVLNVAQYQAIFSIVGTLYGGNGVSNFAIPNLQGRAPIGTGILEGHPFNIGQNGGSFTTGPVVGAVTLTAANTPVGSHTHGATFSPVIGSQAVAIPAIPADPGTPPSLGTVALQANPGITGNSYAIGGSNTFLASTPSGATGAQMWASSAGASPATVGGLNVTLNPGTQGRSAIPAQTATVNTVTGGSVTVAPAGGSGGSTIAVTGTPSVMQPWLALNFIFCMEGLYPMRP